MTLPDSDDPMVGLDPWTAGYIRMRKFLESGPHTEAEVDDLGDAIRATLPFSDPPPEIALVIQADITLVEMGAPATPLDPQNRNVAAYVQKLWTPSTEEE